jgi:catechol 2,3-dioxygenase
MTSIDPAVRIGHVHLKVADIDRALGFYCDLLGFEVRARLQGAAFIAAGDYHHHIGLNTWESAGGSPPPPGTTGLYHTAILYPTRALLAEALQRLIDAKYPLTGASDHGVSEALYLNDPDQNGVELYWDRAKEEWPLNDDGSVAMFTAPLDLDSLLGAAA